MNNTFRVNPGYHYSGESIEITQAITEEQFRAIEDILCRAPQRFKSWAEHFCFDPATPGLAEHLRAYLREQRIAHTTELLQTFALEDPQFKPGRRRQ
jgi:hypothetical protein